jgi:hypothetical protein
MLIPSLGSLEFASFIQHVSTSYTDNLQRTPLCRILGSWHILSCQGYLLRAYYCKIPHPRLQIIYGTEERMDFAPSEVPNEGLPRTVRWC